jgi:hypothetical protein
MSSHKQISREVEGFFSGKTSASTETSANPVLLFELRAANSSDHPHPLCHCKYGGLESSGWCKQWRPIVIIANRIHPISLFIGLACVT